MSAMSVVNATEGLINALAMGLAASGRPAPTGSSPRAINAVRQLIVTLENERAARAALEEENELLRQRLEEATAMLMRARDQLAGR